MVEPVDPLEGGIFDGLEGSPRATAPDDLGLEQADDGLGEGVVVAVADAADRGLDPGLEQAFRVPNAEVLPTPVAMMGQAALRRAAVMQGLFQGIEDKARMRRPRDPPADDAAGEDVDDEGGIDEALPGRDVGEILSANSGGRCEGGEPRGTRFGTWCSCQPVHDTGHVDRSGRADPLQPCLGFADVAASAQAEGAHAL